MYRKGIPLLISVCLILGYAGATKTAGQRDATEEIAIDVYPYVVGKPSTTALSVNDFELYIGGKKQQIATVYKEVRPISLVLIVVTSPWQSCFDQFLPFAPGRLGGPQVLRAGDDVAIVVTDNDGRRIRAFREDISSFPEELSRAAKIARDNQHEELNAQTHSVEYVSGLVYPMPALTSAIDLIKSAPKDHDRLIVFVNGLQNTRTGKRSEAESTFADLFENRITVSWLAPQDSEERFAPGKIPFGKRDYFLGLSSYTGGLYQKCLRRSNSFEDDLDGIMNRVRGRYRIRYYRENDTNGFLPVEIKVRTAGKMTGSPSLHYPQIVKY